MRTTVKFTITAIALGAALLLSACTPEQVCERENTFHSLYMEYIAPHRPADKVAKAVKFHDITQRLCEAGASINEILEAANAADAARTE